MRTLLLSMVMAAFMAPGFSIAAPKDPHHLMWTTAKGKTKCCNKSSKEKAERCAVKMHAKGKATNVQVMAGRCKDM